MKTAHFTICQKPWICPGKAPPQRPLCDDLVASWFAVREELEEWLGIDQSYKKTPAIRNSDWAKRLKGYCNQKYTKIPIDYDIHRLSKDGNSIII